MPADNLTPDEVAGRCRVSVPKVLHWIRIGELYAFDVSANPKGRRPQWRIPLDSLFDFERRRSTLQEASR